MAVKDLDLQRKPAKKGLILDNYGVIVQTTGIQDIYSVDACMANDWLRFIAIDLPEDERERLLWLISQRGFALSGRSPSKDRWETLDSPPNLSVNQYFHTALLPNLGTESIHQLELEAQGSRAVSTEPPVSLQDDEDCNEDTFEALLSKLQFAGESTSDEVLNCVIAIQSRSIPRELFEATTETLLSFIKTHRGSNEVRVLLAVSAAIRKLLLNLEESDLSIAAELLHTDGNLLIPIEVELEVAKMVVHRFKHGPQIDTARLDELAAILIENAKFYSTPKMVNRDKYGATALNSFLGVLLMRHPQSAELCETVMAQAPDWFVDMARRRLQQMVKDIRKMGTDVSGQCETIGDLAIMNDC